MLAHTLKLSRKGSSVKGKDSPSTNYLNIYNTYVVVTPVSIEALPEVLPDLVSITKPSASTV